MPRHVIIHCTKSFHDCIIQMGVQSFTTSLLALVISVLVGLRVNQLDFVQVYRIWYYIHKKVQGMKFSLNSEQTGLSWLYFCKSLILSFSSIFHNAAATWLQKTTYLKCKRPSALSCIVPHQRLCARDKARLEMLTNVSVKVITSWVNANSYTGIVDMF